MIAFFVEYSTFFTIVSLIWATVGAISLVGWFFDLQFVRFLRNINDFPLIAGCMMTGICAFVIPLTIFIGSSTDLGMANLIVYTQTAMIFGFYLLFVAIDKLYDYRKYVILQRNKK